MKGAILTAIRARLGEAASRQAQMPPPPAGMNAFVVDGIALGYLDEPRAARLVRFDSVFCAANGQIRFVSALDSEPKRSAAMAEVARTLAREAALSAWRDELYPVAASFEASPAFVLERAAARYFGIHTWAAHVNGVVAADGGVRMWFARRSPTKAIDPGQLDNLVGGGIAAGRGVAETVVKEAWEEAGIPACLATHATLVASLDVQRANADGLQRETVFAHDLVLPPDFVPVNQDGEAIEHRLVPLDEAGSLIAATRGPDLVTFEASLVVLDYLRRNGALDVGIPEAPRHRASRPKPRRP